MELAILTLFDLGWKNTCILIHFDNQGVIGVFHHGQSRNFHVNLCICHSEAIAMSLNVTHVLTYVESPKNKADTISHGEVGSSNFVCQHSSSQRSSIHSSFLMSSLPSTPSVLPNKADMLAHLCVPLMMPPRFGVLPTSSSSIQKTPKPRKPRKGCELVSSSFRPHVLARDRLRHWMAPTSETFHSTLIKDFSIANIVQLFNVLLVSIEPKTWENYGAGLLHFHQFCNSRNVPESHRMLASDNLLALFISSWAGKVMASTIENWISGLHFWHNMHGALWYGMCFFACQQPE